MSEHSLLLKKKKESKNRKFKIKSFIFLFSFSFLPTFFFLNFLKSLEEKYRIFTGIHKRKRHIKLYYKFSFFHACKTFKQQIASRDSQNVTKEREQFSWCQLTQSGNSLAVETLNYILRYIYPHTWIQLKHPQTGFEKKKGSDPLIQPRFTFNI